MAEKQAGEARAVETAPKSLAATKPAYAGSPSPAKLGRGLGGGACVVKIGGSTLDAAAGVLDALAAAWQAGYAPVVVHGGGPIIDEWLRRLGIAPRFVAGRRVTDAATLEVVRAVMGGAINSGLVAELVRRGVPAVGLSGLAAGMLRAERADAAHGLVGMNPRAEAGQLHALLACGFVPVVAPLALGPAGECLNLNADDAAMAVARALHADHLLFVSDVPGVRDSAGAIIPRLTAERAGELLRDGTVSGGMIPKVEACLAALADVPAIHILDSAAAADLHAVLAGDRAAGTRLAAQ
jgi:acetylglutamate kinase